MNRLHHLISAVLCSCMVWTATGCDTTPIPLQDDLLPDDPDRVIGIDEQDLNRFVQQCMTSSYLWSDEIPAALLSESAAESYDPQALFYSMLHNDPWSSMSTYAYYRRRNEADQTPPTYGGMYIMLLNSQTDRYEVRVVYTIPGSPLWNQGIRRGDRMLELNGTPVMYHLYANTFSSVMMQDSARFSFLRTAGDTAVFTAHRTAYTAHAALVSHVYHLQDRPVGYLVYQHFNQVPDERDTLRHIMTQFAQTGMQDLILDLRYNTGYSYETALHFATYLIPETTADSIPFLFYATHDASEAPCAYIRRADAALNLSRLVVLTTEYTQAAAEMLIHCIQPYIPTVQIVGSETGGQVMITKTFYYPDAESPAWVISPVCSRIANKARDALDSNGIQPDISCNDDFFHNFTVDETTLEGEACLQQALLFLQSNAS